MEEEARRPTDRTRKKGKNGDEYNDEGKAGSGRVECAERC